MRVFITGGSGCVGHYLVHAFLKDPANELVLLLRSPGKLTLPAGTEERVTILKGDLREGAGFAEDLRGIDVGILAATSWGGKHAHDITVTANVALADALIGGGCRHIVYFASASVIDKDLALLPEAAEHGTEYIRAKYRLVEEMDPRGEAARITGIFPTVIFGGGAPPVGAPLSHAARMLFENRRWLPFVRRLSAPGRLHLIHPGDIATLVRHFAGEAPTPGTSRLVLGNPSTTVDELIDAIARAAGTRQSPWLRITERRVTGFARLLGVKMSPWDRYCAENLDQSYPTALSPADKGLPVTMPDLASGLRDIGFPGRA
ncbi:MAG: NAD(P)-dependent oxidoreductase [Paracoccaceae bacterium]|nr:NAD(P)-dependent oxidoreductase [Paracoccaceae bacterium]